MFARELKKFLAELSQFPVAAAVIQEIPPPIQLVPLSAKGCKCQCVVPYVVHTTPIRVKPWTGLEGVKKWTKSVEINQEIFGIVPIKKPPVSAN